MSYNDEESNIEIISEPKYQTMILINESLFSDKNGAENLKKRLSENERIRLGLEDWMTELTDIKLNPFSEHVGHFIAAEIQRRFFDTEKQMKPTVSEVRED